MPVARIPAVVSRRTCAEVSKETGLIDLLIIGKGISSREAMPSSHAMTAAVRGWSPVIISGRMPARLARVTASRARMRRKHVTHPGRFALDRLKGVWTVRQFDEAYTAPAFGFADATDYYHRASAMRVVDRIAIPALLAGIGAELRRMLWTSAASTASSSGPWPRTT